MKIHKILLAFLLMFCFGFQSLCLEAQAVTSKSGEFVISGMNTVVDSDSANLEQPWVTHGALQVSGRYLVYEDGTPFFYLGDTNWDFLRLARREDAVRLINNRRQKGFTVMQASITGAYIRDEGKEKDNILRSNVYGDQPFVNMDVTHPITTPGSDFNDDIQYDFWDHVDYIVAVAESNGIYIGMLMGFHILFEQRVINKDNARTYGRWIGQRYKDSPNIIWILGGDTWEYTGDGEIVFEEMAAGILEGDTGRHLMTFHPRGRSSSSNGFHNSPWLDFNMIQSGHHMIDNPNYEEISSDYNRIPVKPCMDGEPRYEDHSVNWDPENGWFTDFDVRQAAYWSLFAGSHGHTYGNRGVWQMYEPGRDRRGPLNYFWYDAMDMPGGSDMTHVKNLMLSRPFLSRIPDQTLIQEVYSGANHIRATRGEGYAFIYTPAGNTISVELNLITASGNVHAWWYNPQDGACYDANGNLTKNLPFETLHAPFDSFITFDPPGEPLRGNDWVLVLDDALKNFPPPGERYQQSAKTYLNDTDQ